MSTVILNVFSFLNTFDMKECVHIWVTGTNDYSLNTFHKYDEIFLSKIFILISIFVYNKYNFVHE